jgi:hypothetical protein
MEAKYSNNVRELLAGFHGLQAFETDLLGKVIVLQMDNTTALSYIKKMGGKIQLLHQITQDLWNWALQRDIIVIPKFIAGVENIQADYLSHSIQDRSDWMLNRALFQRLNQIWGPHSVDLFATRLNSQVSRFFSWHPEPGAEGIDSFQQKWRGF